MNIVLGTWKPTRASQVVILSIQLSTGRRRTRQQTAKVVDPLLANQPFLVIAAATPNSSRHLGDLSQRIWTGAHQIIKGMQPIAEGGLSPERLQQLVSRRLHKYYHFAIFVSYFHKS